MTMSLAGRFLDDAGGGLSGVTVEAYAVDASDLPTGAALSSDITDANGQWALTGLTAGTKYAIKFTNGTHIRWMDGADKVQVQDLDVTDTISGLPWANFTPTLVQSGTISCTVRHARYVMVGKQVTLEIRLRADETAVTLDAISIRNLPSAITPKHAGSVFSIIGNFIFLNAGTTYYTGAVIAVSPGTQLQFLRDNVSAWMGAVSPLLQNGDEIAVVAFYEAA